MSAAPHASSPTELHRRCGDGWRALVFLATLVTVIGTLAAQAGRRAHPSSEAASLLNVTARRADGSRAPLASRDISLFDNGVEQNLRNFSSAPPPPPISLLFAHFLPRPPRT